MALGRPILSTKARWLSSSERETSRNCLCTLARPCSVASSTGHMAPKATTASTMPPDRPNSAIASGITAEAGSGRMNSSVGAIHSLARRELPISAPSAMPSALASTQPLNMRLSVAQV